MRREVAHRYGTAAHLGGILTLLGVAAVALQLVPTASGRRPLVTSKLPLKAIYGPLTMPDGTSAFPVYHRLGVQVLEMQLDWRAVAPTRPADPGDPDDPSYRWPAALQTAIAEGARYGVQLAFLVEGFPGWANGLADPPGRHWTLRPSQASCRRRAACTRACATG